MMGPEGNSWFTAIAVSALLLASCSSEPDPLGDAAPAELEAGEDDSTDGSSAPASEPGSESAVGPEESQDATSGADTNGREPEVAPTISFVSASTNYSERTNVLEIEVAAPRQIEEGDVLIAQVFARSAPVTALNRGWALVDTENQHRQSVWIKVATDDEPSTYTWIQGNPDQLGRSGVIVAAYRGVDPDDPVVDHAFHSDSGPTRELTAPDVQTQVDAAMVVRMWSSQSPGDGEHGIQPPFVVGLNERGRVFVPIENRAVQTLADHLEDSAGPAGEVKARVTWDVTTSYNHTVVLRPSSDPG